LSSPQTTRLQTRSLTITPFRIENESGKKQWELTLIQNNERAKDLPSKVIATSMWRLVYLFLLFVRVYLALCPSYLHPDEIFQGPEPIAGKRRKDTNIRSTWS
jgi:hypothetical protein